jgi:hypothetical protein
VIDDEPDGRLGPGTTLECVTGRLSTIEQIVDWQPYEHFGYRIHLPNAGTLDAAYDLTETESGTRIRLRIGAADAGDGSAATAGGELAAQVELRRTAIQRLARRLSERSERSEPDPAAVAV